MVVIRDPLVLREHRDLRETPIQDQQEIRDLRDPHHQKVLRVIKVPKDSKVIKVLKEPLVREVTRDRKATRVSKEIKV
jgi:hypothetical protein